jgi:hypothetical protein
MEADMAGKNLRKLLSLSIPTAAILASLFLPLQEVVRQGLIGIILIWFFVEIMTGFPIFDIWSQDKNAPPEI